MNEGDIAVTTLSNIPAFNQGIAFGQGAPGTTRTLAGNIFTSGTTLTNGDYNDAAPQIKYYHHNQLATPTVKVLPTDISVTVDPSPSSLAYNSSLDPLVGSCPSQITGSTIYQVKSAANSSYSLFQSKSSLALTFIDGGNTATLLNRIDTTTASNYNSLKTYLLTQSPWLSYEALLKTAQKLPDTMIVRVFKANPHAGRDTRLIDTLKVNLMATNLIDSIQSVVYNTSARDTLMARIAYYNSDYNRLIDELINIHLEDTTYKGIDSAITILKPLNTLDRDYDLISLYLDNEQVDSAITLLNNMSSYYTLKDQDLINYNDVKYIFRKGDSLDVYKNMYRWHNLDGPSIIHIQGIASTNNYFPGAYACNIIAFLGIDTCTVGYELPAAILPRHAPPAENHRTILQAPTKPVRHLINMYPNPTQGIIYIQYYLPEIKGRLLVQVFNNIGQLLYRQQLSNNSGQDEIQLNGLPSGLYNVTLWEESTLLDSQKLVISDK